MHESSTVLFEAPNWAADDRLVLNGDGLLWGLALDGSAPAQIVFEGLPALNNDHVLGPGGLVYMSADDGHIYEGSLEGGAVRRVTPDDGFLHFLHGVSPDGSTLAYVGITPGEWTSGTLWTVGVSGRGSRQLTSGPGADDGPEYSPSGEWIYFNTERFGGGAAQIARIRPDGSGLEQLTFDERVNWFPHLAGSRAVYLSFPPGTAGHPADLPVLLRLVDGDDWRSARTVVSLDGGQGTINVNSWSPAGDRFAYVDYPVTRSASMRTINRT
ncbi:TolB family protein [Actinoplanes sp. CA-030573]|uniref:TolB family protein n=1 Tax=Actinoplanes sp. CA-030573 TaxID=3239898 RepID=UPI003D8EDEDC